MEECDEKPGDRTDKQIKNWGRWRWSYLSASFTTIIKNLFYADKGTSWSKFYVILYPPVSDI